MPELPEVETVRLGLAPVLETARIARAEVRRPDLRWPLPDRMAARLEGQQIGALGRRGKYLLVPLEGGETWLIHLGMSGRVLIGGTAPGMFHHAQATASPHDHVEITTDSGATVTFNDPRRFGAMDLWPSDDLPAHPWLAKMGPEPLSNGFSGAVLARAFEGKRAPVKTALLDQRVVAGLGNIYVCEALHTAGIHPARAAGRIGAARLDKLATTIRDTLTRAIAAGGSSLRDHRQATGDLGYFQHSFRAYDRDGAPCPTPDCGGTITRITQSARSTYYCPQCQR